MRGIPSLFKVSSFSSVIVSGLPASTVNSISAGPVKTLAASAIGEFRKILDYCENTSPLKTNVSVQDISKTALYLLSDLSTGITAENIHCDCGVSSIGFYQNKEESI